MHRRPGLLRPAPDLPHVRYLERRLRPPQELFREHLPQRRRGHGREEEEKGEAQGQESLRREAPHSFSNALKNAGQKGSWSGIASGTIWPSRLFRIRRDTRDVTFPMTEAASRFLFNREMMPADAPGLAVMR